MAALFTRMATADEALERAQADYAAQLLQAEIESHGLDLLTREQALAEADLAEAGRVAAYAQLPAARREADRLRSLINTDFTPARNDRVKAWREARSHAGRLDTLSRQFGHYFNRANACRYRANLLP